jgi:hypothetical protein
MQLIAECMFRELLNYRAVVPEYVKGIRHLHSKRISCKEEEIIRDMFSLLLFTFLCYSCADIKEKYLSITCG